jgi:uncharacterized MAPEG superfamily protein
VTMNFLGTTNLSFYTIPAAYILCTAPHVYATILYSKTTGIKHGDSSVDKETSISKDGQLQPTPYFDQTQPRTFLSTVDANPSPKLTPQVRQRIARAEAASANGYENIGFFSSAVVAANLGFAVFSRKYPDVSTERKLFWINVLSFGYVVSRGVYTIEYTNGVSGFRRGGWFWTGVFIATSLFLGASHSMIEVI